MNKKGQMVMIQLVLLVMTIGILMVITPIINTFLNLAKQSDGLNCDGYIHNGDANNSLSYNSSLNTDSITCMLFKLFVPYIVLGVLIYGVGNLFRKKLEPDYGGGQYYG